jgi:hypothetical protein
MMATNILLEGQTAPSTGVLMLHVDREIEIRVPAEKAQHEVNRFIHMEVSTQMHAEAPMLVVSNKTFWRVPIHLTFPTFGDVGCVGFIHVDPITGKLETSQTVIKEIEQNADDLAIRFASPTTQPG